MFKYCVYLYVEFPLLAICNQMNDELRGFYWFFFLLFLLSLIYHNDFEVRERKWAVQGQIVCVWARFLDLLNIFYRNLYAEWNEYIFYVRITNDNDSKMVDCR